MLNLFFLEKKREEKKLFKLSSQLTQLISIDLIRSDLTWFDLISSHLVSSGGKGCRHGLVGDFDLFVIMWIRVPTLHTYSWPNFLEPIPCFSQSCLLTSSTQ